MQEYNGYKHVQGDTGGVYQQNSIKINIKNGSEFKQKSMNEQEEMEVP